MGDQRLVIVAKRRRTRQNQRRNLFPIGPMYYRIGYLHNMQYHRIICRIEMMIVPAPIRSPPVNFHISRPYATIDRDFRIEKIGARIGIQPPDIDYPQLTPVYGCQPRMVEQSMLPHILHEFFHKKCFYSKNFSIFTIFALDRRGWPSQTRNHRSRLPLHPPFAIWVFAYLQIKPTLLNKPV